MGLSDGFGDVDEFPSVALGVGAEEFESLLFVNAVDGHENAFGAFDRGAPAEGAFEVVVFGEAAEDDVER